MRSLSIIIPAYNEAENIIDTLGNVTRALEPLAVRHEILVIDDGSTDATAALVTSNLNRFPAVRLLVNERNMGFGWSYRRGVDAAALDHIVMVHGDNAWGYETLREFFSHVGEADVIVGYTRDMWSTRTKTRTLISKGYTFVVNLITRRRLKYYNGLQIHTAPVLKSLRIQSSGYGFQSEVLVKSLRRARTRPRSADGSDRAREGREQGVPPQECRRRVPHAQGAVRRGARPRCLETPEDAGFAPPRRSAPRDDVAQARAVRDAEDPVDSRPGGPQGASPRQEDRPLPRRLRPRAHGTRAALRGSGVARRRARGDASPPTSTSPRSGPSRSPRSTGHARSPPSRSSISSPSSTSRRRSPRSRR